ncbi:hypothetical protein CEP53_008699 [Fusarium sp. AF-6]|nr:hypothetical protein CEP53_008699 [Fusarium sp. AF-6]
MNDPEGKVTEDKLDPLIGPFIKRFQSSSQPYPDSPPTEDDEGHVFKYLSPKDTEFVPPNFGNQNEGQVIQKEKMTDVDFPHISDYVTVKSRHLQDNRVLLEPLREGGEHSENTMGQLVSPDLESFGDNSDLGSETLRYKLMGGVIRSRVGRKTFIPGGHVERVVNEQAVAHELKDCLHPDAHHGEMQQNANEIIKRCKKIFAILVLIEKVGCIVDFLREGINDIDLPFSQRRNLMSIQRFKIYPREGSEPLKASAKWTRLQKKLFLEWQWVILAPFFSREKDGKELLHPIKYGRHGDIKPENILWFNDGTKGGTLKITDFVLTKFHTWDIRSSRCYRPPEVELGDGLIRPSYDIWSMGCLYLEFLAWLLGGCSLVSEMAVARQDGEGENFLGDNPYYNINDARTEAMIEPTFIEDAHTHPKCSRFVHEFLDIILTDLLVVETGD